MITVGLLLEKRDSHIFTISPDNTLQEALEIMAKEKISSLPVVNEKNELIGIISERDYIRKAIPERKIPWEIHVRDYMTSDVITVVKTDLLQECMKIMSSNRIRHLPVLEDGKMVGVISITDVVRVLRSCRLIMDDE